MRVTRLRKQYAHVGDDLKDCTLVLFADDDAARDKTDSAGASDAFVAVSGPRTYVPIKAVRKKQTCSRHSAREEKVVTMKSQSERDIAPS